MYAYHPNTKLFLSLLTGHRKAPKGHVVRSSLALPPCDSTRRLLAMEYARLHWRLKTSAKADSTEGWWLMQAPNEARGL